MRTILVRMYPGQQPDQDDVWFAHTETKVKRSKHPTWPSGRMGPCPQARFLRFIGALDFSFDGLNPLKTHLLKLNREFPLAQDLAEGIQQSFKSVCREMPIPEVPHHHHRRVQVDADQGLALN